MLGETEAPPAPGLSRKLRIIDLVRPHWKALTIALVAVLGETLTDILDPWPIKIVVDNILQSKKHTRVTSDIAAVQDFINSALLGMVIDVLTLVGMIGVMFYLNWRFTLIALSVSPVLFLVVYSYTRISAAEPSRD